MARTPDTMSRPRYGGANGFGTDAGDRHRGTDRGNAHGADPEKLHGRHGATARDGETEHGETRAPARTSTASSAS
jgi:hypothetical protein